MNLADALVQKHLLEMRAPLRQRRTVIGRAGTFRSLEDGERVLTLPDGTRVRVIERADPEFGRSGGNQIEHGDHLHAVVRPRTHTLSMSSS